MRSPLGTALKAAKVLAVPLVLALVYYVLKRIGFRSILDEMRKLGPVSIRNAALLYFAALVLWSFRWQQLMKRGERRSLAALFPIYMSGVFGNVITPGARIGGEPIRAYYMSKAFGGEKSAYLGTILADKVGNGSVFIGFVLLSAILGLLFVPAGMAPKIVLLGGVILAAAVAAGVTTGFLLRKRIGVNSPLFSKLLSVIYNSALLKFIRTRFSSYQHFEDYAARKLENITGPIRQVATSPKSIAKIVVISVASWILIYSAHYVLFIALGAQIGFLRVLIIVTFATLCGDLSVSPGGAGFMEAAMIGLCAAFGVDYSTAAAVTLISRGIFYAYGLGVGGLCLVGLACLYGRK